MFNTTVLPTMDVNTFSGNVITCVDQFVVAKVQLILSGDGYGFAINSTSKVWFAPTAAAFSDNVEPFTLGGPTKTYLFSIFEVLCTTLI